MDLDKVEMFSQIDKSNMMGLVLGLPEEILEAVEIGFRFDLPEGYKRYSKILVTGMGGSGIPGDFLTSLLLKELSVPLVVNKDYSIPHFTDKDTLVFAISYSGMTEETIAAFQAARRVGAKIIGVTSGGELLLLCQDEGIPYIKMPQGRQTRASFGYLLFSVLIALQRLDAITDKTKDIQETVQVVRKMPLEIGPSVAMAQNPAKSLASMLYGKFAVLFGSHAYTDVVASRWKQQLNENSKFLARCDTFPELNHNEIVGWESPELTQNEVVFLRDDKEPPRIKRRIEVTKEFLKSRQASVTEVWSQGDSVLARLLSLSYLGDFVSLYLAILNEVDPTPTEAIVYLKQKMAAREG